MTELDTEDEPSDDILIDAEGLEDSETIECPKCGLSGEVPDWFIGEIVECKGEDCGRRFEAHPVEEVES